jgi:hypothetical protein
VVISPWRFGVAGSASFDRVGDSGAFLALFLDGHFFREPFRFRLRQLQYLKQFLHQRFFLREVTGFRDFLRLFVEALEVGAGDLQGVEHEGGALGVHGLVGEEAHDLEEGVLQAHGVLDHAESVVGLLGVGGVVEDAVVATAAGRGGAGSAVQFGVLTAGSVIEFGNRHRFVPPSRGYVLSPATRAGVPRGRDTRLDYPSSS